MIDFLSGTPEEEKESGHYSKRSSKTKRTGRCKGPGYLTENPYDVYRELINSESADKDFELDYYLKDWCKKNGFKVISCEGDGDDSGFEPDSVRRWIKY